MADYIARHSASAVGDATAAAARLNKAGEIVSTPWEIQMMLEGRCFVAGTGAEEAGVAGIAALDEQTPVFGLVAPSGGTVMIPRVFRVHYDTEAGAAPADMHLVYVQLDKGATSGTELPALNCLGGENPRAALGSLRHTLTALTAITSAQNVSLTSRLHILDNLQSAEMVATDANIETMDRSPMELIYDCRQFPIGLYGASALLFYAIDATARYNVSAAWIEVPSNIYVP
jgi:hypothetical protein